MNSQLDLSIPLPITSDDKRLAQTFADEQVTPEKTRQVYRNTLAVLAVNRYLNLQGFETDLNQSDCLQPVLRRCSDVADLKIANLGKLECTPLSAAKTTFEIPPESQFERLGHLAVRLDEEATEAKLLGFVRRVNLDEDVFTLELASLESMDDLMDYLCDLEKGREVAEIVLGRLGQNLDDVGVLLAESQKIIQNEPAFLWGAEGERLWFEGTGSADLRNRLRGMAVTSRERGDSAPELSLEEQNKRRELVENLFETLAKAWNIEF